MNRFGVLGLLLGTASSVWLAGATGPAHATFAGRAGRIAFTSNASGNNEVYTINPDGSGIVDVTNDPSDDGRPDYSPDGSKIAFRSNRAGNQEIYSMNADGSGVARLTFDPAYDVQPVWSPDGR
jgi:Tol biopolymer transport system component